MSEALEVILAYEISDEFLESAAENERANNYTFFFCTALDHCPGPQPPRLEFGRRMLACQGYHIVCQWSGGHDDTL